MAATRSSDHFNSLFYTTSYRGRSLAHDISMEQFPGKYESTDIYEDPDDVYQHNRRVLKDFTPDNNRLLPDSQSRRDTHAKEKINLRLNGSRNDGTDPYKNEGFDTQHYDHDPRGWSTEQNWDEYKRNMTSRIRRTDFKDDSDYSVPESGIHPNVLYKNIRQTQNWFKSYFKNFDTAKTSRHTGGVGTYDNISAVFKSEHEDSTVMIDGKRAEFDDPVIHLRATRLLSNWVHGGSKALRANTTTDHKVKVASYGKLLRQRGLIPFESQMRLVEDDTNWSKIGGMSNDTRNLVKLMSSIVNGKTVAQTEREFNQEFAESPQDTEKFKGGKYSQHSQEPNKSLSMTKDIMSLLGVTQNEIKFLESMANKNDKQAKRHINDLYRMTEYLHKLPIDEKRKIKQDLLTKAAGGGLMPASLGEIRKNLDKSIINPKIMRTLKDITKKQNFLIGTEDAKNVIGDPENKLEKALANIPLYVSKRKYIVDASTGSGQTGENFASKSKTTHKYKNLSKFDKNAMKNRESSTTDILFSKAKAIQNLLSKNKYDEDITKDFHNTALDNIFGENKTFTRKNGRIGTRATGRHQESTMLNNYNEFTRDNTIRHVKNKL